MSDDICMRTTPLLPVSKDMAASKHWFQFNSDNSVLMLHRDAYAQKDSSDEH